MDSIQTATQILDRAAAEKRPATAEELATIQKAMLADDRISTAEAQFLSDRLKRREIGRNERPVVYALLTRSLTDNPENLVLQVGKSRFTHVKAVAEDLDLEAARAILDNNKIDEIYVQTPDGRLFIAHGPAEKRGALAIDGIKAGFIGKINDQKVTVVYVDDETNTIRQGAVAPLKGTAQVIKDASESGIVRGIGEVGAMVTAIFVGRTVIENGIRAATGNAATAVPAVTPAVTQAVATAGKVTAKTIATGARTMIKDGLRTAGVVGAVAGVVVGGVALVLAGVGAVKGRLTKPKVETLDMATDQKLEAPARK